MSFPRNVLLVAAILAIGGAASRAGAETIRCPVTADAAAIPNYEGDIADACVGGTKTINIEGFASLGMFQFDMTAAQGLKIAKAELLLKRDAGDLATLTVSTISATWKPTAATDPKDTQPQEGCSSYSWRIWSKDPTKRLFWAGPGTQLTDAIFGQGNSLCGEVRVSLADDDWYHIPVPAEMVATLALGTQYGLCLYDTAGQRRTPGTVMSAASGEGGYLLITGTKDDAKPAAVLGLSADSQLDDPGQVRLTWTVPAGEGAARVRGYRVSYAEGTDKKAELLPLPTTYLVPQPVKPDTRQTALVRDLDLQPGQAYRFAVATVSETGAIGAPETVTARASKGKPVPSLKIEMKQPKVVGSGTPSVWAIPETENISPTTGNRLQDGLDGYIQGPAAGTHRLLNDIWNDFDKGVRLEGGRNWFYGFQLVAQLEGKTRKLQLTAEDLAGPQVLPAAKSVRIYRVWYVRGAKGKEQEGWFGDPLVPLTEAISLPAKDNAVEGQANQAFFVDLYVPHQARTGTYKTTLHVTDLDDPAYKADIAVKVTVHPVTLPDTLSFIAEMNAYSSPARLFKGAAVGSPRYLTLEREYHRMAHEHRCNLNILGYTQTGQIKDNYAPPVAGAGKDMHVADWSKFDEQFGPYLDGSAFADLPRTGVPVPTMYLPFHENWPCPVSMMKPEGQACLLKGLLPKYRPAGAAEFIQEHYKGELTMEQLFPAEYEQGDIAVARQFRDHFKEKGWTRTDFQIYLNNKYYWKEVTPKQKGDGISWWLLDEPNHHYDVVALRYYGQLFKKGFEAAAPVRVIYRCDISRFMWVRDVLDGVLDMIAVSRRFNLGHAWLADKTEKLGWQVWSYSGHLNTPSQPHRMARTWCLNAWLNEAHGILWWQSIGQNADYARANQEALLLPGERFNIDGPIGTLRVKQWRSAQQDVELLNLLAGAPGWDRKSVAAALAAACKQAGLDNYLYVDPVTTAYDVNHDTPYGFYEGIRQAVYKALPKTTQGK